MLRFKYLPLTRNYHKVRWTENPALFHSRPAMMPQFDPSKMDPKVLMELSTLIQQLPPDKLTQMQSLMHNMMAGFDVSKEMEAFEKSLPPGFRDKMMSMIAGQMGTGAFGFPPGAGMGMGASPAAATMKAPAEEIEIQAEDHSGTGESNPNMDMHVARMTVLKAVADGRMSPEDAERVLFTA
jgi:hypothetical protein